MYFSNIWQHWNERAAIGSYTIIPPPHTRLYGALDTGEISGRNVYFMAKVAETFNDLV